jgi:hypothetical protein
VSSLDGSYRQMAKQSHENYKMKVIFYGSIVNTMNYLMKVISIFRNNIYILV